MLLFKSIDLVGGFNNNGIFEIYFDCQAFDNGWDFWKIKTFLNILYLGFTNKGMGGCGSYLCYLAVGVREIKFIYQFTSSSQTCGMRIETISMLWFWTRNIFILSSLSKLHVFKIQLQIHGLQNVFLILLSTLSALSLGMWCHPLLAIKLTSLFHTMNTEIHHKYRFINSLPCTAVVLPHGKFIIHLPVIHI